MNDDPAYKWRSHLSNKIYRGNWARDGNVNEIMVTKGDLVLT